MDGYHVKLFNRKSRGSIDYLEVSWKDTTAEY